MHEVNLAFLVLLFIKADRRRAQENKDMDFGLILKPDDFIL